MSDVSLPINESDPHTSNESHQLSPETQHLPSELSLAHFFPHLSVAPPLPLKLSPLYHLPSVLALYTTLLQSYQTNATEESRIYQRRQYADVISETLLEVLRECLEFDVLDDKVKEEAFLNDKYLAMVRGMGKREGWLKLVAAGHTEEELHQQGNGVMSLMRGNSEEFSKLQFRQHSSSQPTLGTSRPVSSRSHKSLFKQASHNLFLTQSGAQSDTGSVTGSHLSTPRSPRPLDDSASMSSEWSSHIGGASTHVHQTDEELALIRERSEQMARIRAFETAQRSYHHFITIGKRHLGLILYGDEQNAELLREKVAKKMELILERFEFSIMAIFKKESLNENRNLSREHKLLMDTLAKELLAQRNIGDAMKERIQEIISEEQKNKHLIEELKKKVEVKDALIVQMREQYTQDTEELREQLLRKEELQRGSVPAPSQYDPDDYNIFFLNRADRSVEAMLEQERAHFQGTLANLQKEYEQDRDRLIKEKYVALDALKRHLFLETNFQVFDEVMVPVNMDPSAVDPQHNESHRDYKHLKVITTQNMETVRQKYEAMRTMMEQMQAELYKQFDEKEKLDAKVSELYRKLRSYAGSANAQASAQDQEQLSELKIQVNTIQLEKDDMEQKLKELMFENQQSRHQMKDDVDKLKSALEKAERSAEDCKKKLETVTEENKILQLREKEMKKRFIPTGKNKGTDSASSSQGRPINIKRTSTDAGIQFGSHRLSLTLNHYTKEQQTKPVHIVPINSDDDEDAVTRDAAASNHTKFVQTPRANEKKHLADKSVQMQQQQQTSPRLMRSYVKDHLKDFSSLFPRPKARAKSWRPARTNRDVNYIEKNAQIAAMDDSTRQLVDDLIAIDEHNQMSMTETDVFMSTVQNNTHKSIHNQHGNAFTPQHPHTPEQVSPMMGDTQLHDSEDYAPAPRAVAAGNKSQRPRPKTTALPGRHTHYTMEMEREFHNPTTKVHLADYLKAGDDVDQQNNEDATNSRLMNSSELKPGIAIVELIDPKEKKKKSLKKNSNTFTVRDVPMDKDFQALADIDINLRREHKKIEEYYEKKIALLKEQKRVLQQKLEASTITADTMTQLKREARHELKEKHASELARLNSKLEKAQRQVAIYEQVLSKVDVSSYLELTQTVKEAMEMEKQCERMGMREEKLRQEASLRSLYASITQNSNSDSPAADPNDFSYQPESVTRGAHHDLEKFQQKLDNKWKKVLSLSRSLSSSKKLSKLAVKQLDAEAHLGETKVSDEIRKGLPTSFKPKKLRLPKQKAVNDATKNATAEKLDIQVPSTSAGNVQPNEAREMPMSAVRTDDGSEDPFVEVKKESSKLRSNSRASSRAGKVAVMNSSAAQGNAVPKISLSESPSPPQSRSSSSAPIVLPKTVLHVETSLPAPQQIGNDPLMKAWSRNESPSDDSFLEEEQSKEMVVALSQRPQSQSAAIRTRNRVPSRGQTRPKSTNPPNHEFVLGPPSLKPRLKPKHTGASSRGGSSKQTKLPAASNNSAPLPNKRAQSSLGFRKPLPMNPSIVEAQKQRLRETAPPATDTPQHPVYTLQHSDLIHLAKAQQHSNVMDKIFIDQQKQHLFGVGKPNYKLDG